MVTDEPHVPPPTREQVIELHWYAVATVNALIAAGDMDLWLRWAQLGREAIAAARRADPDPEDGPEPHSEPP